jgi:uncharacterized protein
MTGVTRSMGYDEGDGDRPCPSPPELRDAIARVLARVPEVAVAYVFGSVARGEARADSDLDVGLVYAAGAGGAHGRVVDACLGPLMAETGFAAIDLIDLEAQGPIFAHAALCESALVYESSRSRRVDFESETFSRALDFRPTYDLATRGKVRALRHWLEKRYDI